jgi:hypothetical protein
MKTVLLLTIVASAVAAFGTFVLPRAAKVEQPQAVPSERLRLVLASVGPSEGDDRGSCGWKHDRRVRTTVLVDRSA